MAIIRSTLKSSLPTTGEQLRISHSHKFLFLSNPKSGSETIRSLLNDVADLRFDKQVSIPGFEAHCPAGFPQDFITPHTTAKVSRAYFSFNGWAWEDYYKFTSIRNPWDKMVSTYHYGNPDKQNRYFWEDNYEAKGERADFSEWLIEKGIRFYPIKYFAYDNNECLVDDIVRVEDYPTAIPEILKKFNLKIEKIPRINTTKRGHYREYFNDDTRKLVAEKFELDIKIGDYTF